MASVSQLLVCCSTWWSRESGISSTPNNTLCGTPEGCCLPDISAAHSRFRLKTGYGLCPVTNMKKFILIFTILVGVGFGYSKVHATTTQYYFPYPPAMNYEPVTSSVVSWFPNHSYSFSCPNPTVPDTGLPSPGGVQYLKIGTDNTEYLLTSSSPNYSFVYSSTTSPNGSAGFYLRGSGGWGSMCDVTTTTIVNMVDLNSLTELSFITPTSSAITNGFNYWKINYTNPTTSLVQLSPVIWWGTSQNCFTTSTGCNVDTSNIYVPGIYYDLSSSNSLTLTILKSVSLVPAHTYYASVHDLISGVSAEVTFSTPYGPLLPQTTTSVTQISTSGPGFLFWEVTSSTSQCVPAADWTDVGGGIKYGFCSAIEWLLIPDNSNVNFMQNALLRYKTLFPFNLIFMTYDNLYAGISEGNKTQKTLTFSLPQVGLNATILSATTLSGQMSTSTYSTYMETATNFIWLASAIAIFIILLV